MNIPEHILQQVADEAFLPSSKIVLTTSNIFDDWKNQAKDRRAVIQHAISNPALAPFLVSGIGEYTDMEIADAWRSANLTMPFVSEIKRFLAALPRRESPAFAEVIARAEKAEAELAAIKSSLPAAEPTPPVQAEPAAQVPLGPEDCPPGSAVRCDNDHWFQVLYASPIGVCINNVGLPVQYRWTELAERWQINYSIPDTGRWDANAWRPCSKPGK